jgi:hypothetical protein
MKAIDFQNYKERFTILIDDNDEALVRGLQLVRTPAGCVQCFGMRRGPLASLFLLPKKGLVIDHINRNPLDFQRHNLRYLDHSESSANTRDKGNYLGYKGVTYNRSCQNFVARLMIRGKTYLSAGHQTAREAALAYDRLCTRLRPGIAATNQQLGNLQ